MGITGMLGCIAAVLIVAASTGESAPIAGIDIGHEYEARVRAGIEQNRKSGAMVHVVNAEGRPTVGARVDIKQKTHDFLFGCAFPQWEAPPEKLGKEGWENWNRYFTRIFNYATTENSAKWKNMEREQGKVNYASIDFIAQWCAERDIKLKGHTLVWGTKAYSFPDWLEGNSPEQLEALVSNRVHDVVSRYKGRIDVWDVVNEPVHCKWFEENWDADYAVKCYKWAREANPNAKLVINDFAGILGEVDKFVPYVEQLMKQGAPIDAIGEQAHDPPIWYTPRQVFQTLDKMASLGLPIHITELTYPNNDAEIAGDFVKGKWDGQKQGEFYRYFVTLCFSHPSVEAITLWAMWDGSTWLKPGGIIREDWTPKPAYDALDDLINRQWHTEFAARSDTNGEVRFRGFHGNYEVTVIGPDGRTQSEEFHLAKGLDNRLTLTLR